MLVSIVIPCYNSESTIGKVVDLCYAEFEKLDGYECEMILVNDYSKDGTFRAIRAAAEKHPRVLGVDLARNCGQHAAIMAGMQYVNGDLVMGMDDDLQTHPSQIPAFIRKAEEGYDVVFGHFRDKKFGPWKKFLSNASSFVMDLFVPMPKDVKMNNFWLARRYVIDEARKYRGTDVYIQLLFFRTTDNMANVDIDHFARESGRSNYTFRKGMKLFLSFMNYSILPLRAASILGIVFAVVGLVGSVAVLINKITNPAVAIGWSSIMCALLILFGLCFFILGIIGEYVGKTILTLNETPLFVVRETTDDLRSGDEHKI